MKATVKEENNPRGASVIERLSREVFTRYARWDSTSVMMYLRLGGKVFVARSDGEVLGGAFLRRLTDELWELTMIGVFPDYRMRGVGKAIMRKILESVRGEIYLHVSVDNSPAIKLYEDFGFLKVKRISRFYSTGEDAYLMVLKRTPRRPEKESDVRG